MTLILGIFGPEPDNRQAETRNFALELREFEVFHARFIIVAVHVRNPLNVDGQGVRTAHG